MRVGFLGMTTIDTLIFTDSIPRASEGLGRVNECVVSLGGKGMVTALSAYHLGCTTLTFTLIGDRSELMKLLPNGFCSDYFQESLLTNNKTWIGI